MDEVIGCDKTDTLMAFTSISFDISVLELFWPLCRGAHVLIKSDPLQNQEESEVSTSLADEIRKANVTMLQSTPSMLSLLVKEKYTELEELKVLILGGEALPLSLAQELKTSISTRIINMYGPTETTIWSTSEDIEEDVSVIKIGKPIANTSAYILDRFMKPCA